MPGFAIKGQGSGPPNNFEFHRQHRWVIEDLGLPTGTPANEVSSTGAGNIVTGPTRTRSQGGSGSAAPNGFGGPTRKVLFAQSLQLPSLEFEEEVIKSPSVTYKVAKRAKWKNCVVKFYDVWGLFIEFDKWHQKIWTPDRGIQAAIDYKGEPKFVLTDGQGQVKQRYTLMGAYPLSIDHGELTYTSHEVKLLIVNYSYDYATVELFDQNQP